MIITHKSLPLLIFSKPKVTAIMKLNLIIVMSLIYGLGSGCNGKENQVGYIEQFDPALEQVIEPDAKVEIIAEGFEWSEGPLWLEEEDMLLFSDMPVNTIFKWTKEKGKEVYLTPSGYTSTVKRGGETGSNGLLLNHNRELILCQHGDRR